MSSEWRLLPFTCLFGVLLLAISIDAIKADVILSGRPRRDCESGQGVDPTALQTCYTCMGYDMTNCDWGTVCCAGSCFKLVDEEMNIIAKGCSQRRFDDGHSAVKLLDGVKVARKEDVRELTGKIYYCGGPGTKDKKYCNASSRIAVNVALLTVIACIFTKAAFS